MKTVTGKLVSTKPISLSNAAKYISRFISSDNGASHAVGVYLQRSSDSFNNLVQFQKKLKSHHSHGKDQASQPLNWDVKVETSVTADETPHVEKRKNSESKGKGKKNLEFELKNDVPLDINQDEVVVEEVKVEKSLENKGIEKKNQKFGVNNETVQIDQNSDMVVEKKRKKKSGKKVVNDGPVVFEQDVVVVGKIKGEKSSENKGKDKKNQKFDVKTEETVHIEQSPEGVLKKNKKKKSRLVKNHGPVVIEQDADVVGEIKVEKTLESIGIDKKNDKCQQNLDGVVEERKNKKYGKKGKNEEIIQVGRGADGEDADEKVLDEGGEKSKQENVEVEGGSVKRDKKKKRKKSEGEGVEEDFKGEECREVDGGEMIDPSEGSGKKKGRKSEGFDKTGHGIFEDGDMNGVEGVSVQRRDKKKKRKESEGKEVEESIMGEQGKKQKSRKVDGEATVDLPEWSAKRKGSKADGNDKIKQDNAEVKEEMDRIEEGSEEMGNKKKKKNKREIQESFGGEEGKKRKSGEVDGEETLNSADQSGKQKRKRRKTEGDDK